MALNSRGAIDPRWVTHNIPVERSLAYATIEIFNPKSADNIYDPATNTWSTDVEVVWEGKARIQPRNATARLGSAGTVISAIDPGASQIVEVNIGLRDNQLLGSNGVMPDLRPGFKMRVTDSPIDPALCNFDFVVRSVINSSNPWNRQLLCEVNQELNPNNG